MVRLERSAKKSMQTYSFCIQLTLSLPYINLYTIVSMKKSSFFVGAAVCLGVCLTSCADHFMADSREREMVKSDLALRQEALAQGPYFDVFASDTVTLREKEALQFLYAYMPLPDLVDYPASFHLMNVRYAFKAQREMPWGRSIPEREFRHFVLPYRVNNENLDEARRVFYDELKPRVQDLSLREAVLEVNHWCHEKVVYRPSDARTSAPLASVKTAYGRCGEESTFLVSALRAVGIPARQVYTPRWAHTDDNHAWVEAWVDGSWHFLGACEPEPVLDLGWFNAPAARGMLMHTKVFGRYNGPEEVIRTTPNYTEINVIENYADAARGEVCVTDANGQPVDSAKVEFKIYNYAEFFTTVTKYTNAEGLAWLTAGQGDMLVWASKDGRYGFGKLSFGKETGIEVVLDKTEGEVETMSIDVVPPVEKAVEVKVTDEQRAENTRRMAVEDSIRNAYVATFPSAEQAREMAVRLDVDADLWTDLLVKARGNWKELEVFVETTDKAQRTRALRLLQVVSEKDLRDTPADVLADHLQNTPASNSSLADRYLLNARVANELLTPYKGYLKQHLGAELVAGVQANPSSLIDWCNTHLQLRDNWNTSGALMSPRGVWESRVTDSRSRAVFFVAVMRTLGIPARVDEVTGKLQYADAADRWVDVRFTAEVQQNAPQGKVVASYRPVKALENPLYYSHYTLSRFVDGTFRLMNFAEDETSSWRQLLSHPLSMDVGYYMLTTGTRLANGSVLARVSFFTVEEGKTTHIDLDMRDNPDEVKIIGNLNAEDLYLPAGLDEAQSLLSTTGRGYYVVGILEPGAEPTNHALRDIAALSAEFEQWGRPMVLLFPNEEMRARFHAGEFPGLPSTIHWGVDQNNRILGEVVENLHLMSRTSLPVFVIADTFNRVVFVSQGYTIGLGEQLMKVIRKL